MDDCWTLIPFRIGRQVGAKLWRLCGDERLRVVWDALKGRHKELLSRSHAGLGGKSFVSQLTAEERAIFDRGHEATASFRRWRYREGERPVSGA